jgi:hypothetical protein
MHCRETKHGANRDGDEKLLSELEERQPVSDASAEDVSDELVQEGPYWWFPNGCAVHDCSSKGRHKGAS